MCSFFLFCFLGHVFFSRDEGESRTGKPRDSNPPFQDGEPSEAPRKTVGPKGCDFPTLKAALEAAESQDVLEVT